MRQTLIKKNTEEREKKKKKRGEREAAPGAVRKYVSAALRRRRIDAPRAYSLGSSRNARALASPSARARRNEKVRVADLESP